MEYFEEIKSNEEIANILNKVLESIQNINNDIATKNDLDILLKEAMENLKEARKISKKIGNKIADEKDNIEEYMNIIKEVYTTYTNDRVEIIKGIINSNIADGIATNKQIVFGKIDDKEIEGNRIYTKDIENKGEVYLFKPIVVKDENYHKKEIYKCIGLIKINETKYDENNNAYNTINLKVENEDISTQDIYDKYKVCPLINDLNNKILYKNN